MKFRVIVNGITVKENLSFDQAIDLAWNYTSKGECALTEQQGE